MVALVATTISADALAPGAPDQQIDREIVWSNALQRRDGAVQHVIQPLKPARVLNRHQVERVLDHANQRGVARRVLADGTRIGVREVAAALTSLNALVQGRDGRPQDERLAGRPSQQKEGQALRGLGANGGKPRELVDQPRDRAGERVRHSLAEARNFQAAGQSAKLALGQLLRLLDRIVHRHHDHVGKQLGILGVDG